MRSTDSLNLGYLRTFVYVVELGSFSAAAERLRLSQPAISLQIRNLEKHVGVPLIERVGRTTRPTAAGSDLLEHIPRIEASVTSALEDLARHRTGTIGRVRLGTGATACIFLLPPMFRELRERLPSLEITIQTGNTSDIVRAIQENTLDIGFVTMPVASGRTLEVTPVMDEEFVLVAPAGTRLPARATAELLATLPLILFEARGHTRQLIDRWCAQRNIDLKPIMSFGSMEAIKELVGAGLGCALLPAMAVGSARDRSDLVVRSLSPPLHRTLGIVVRRDKRLHRGLREMIRALKRLSVQS